MLVFAAIVPHPPESIPGIGNAETPRTIQKTLEAFDELRIGLEKSDPETIVIISPHANSETYSFVINSSSELTGSFAEFGLDEMCTYINDTDLANRLVFLSELKLLPVRLQESLLDYGTLIPLYHLVKNIRPKIMQLSFSKMSYDFHFRFGEALQKVIQDMSGKRVAILASGQLSHRLTPDAPAGFSPKAQEFDRAVLHYLGANDVTSIMNLEQQVNSEIAECAMRSIIILLGALHGLKYKFDLLSYEGPTGIGYLTARMI